MRKQIICLQKKGYLFNKAKETQKSCLKKALLSAAIHFINLILKASNFFYGAFIPVTAKIGNNVCFKHSLHGVFISQKAVIGNNCTILHHVTIGSIENDSGEIEAPVIGDNVYIGCNVCIVGKTVIGNNSKIGAGTTIVNGSIPENTTVVGQKWRELRIDKE